MPAVCPLCEGIFASEAALLEHCGGVLPEAEDEPFWCSCGAQFCAPQAMAEHCETSGHKPEGAYDGPAVDPANSDEIICPLCEEP